MTWPPLTIWQGSYFYFTIFPHVSSGLNPVAVSSPQMYSGLLVLYGVYVGILAISVRSNGREGVGVLPLVLALMVAAMARFRIHIFLVLFPGFLLLMLSLWWRTRVKLYLVSGAVAVAVSLLLYLETRSAVYLADPAAVRLEYNGLSRTIPFLSRWPYASESHALLGRLFEHPVVVQWAWQALVMSAFVFLNMVGIPLLVVTVTYLISKAARREFPLFSGLMCWLVVWSLLGAMVIRVDDDQWSLAGQLLLHTRWYVYPLTAVGGYALLNFVARRVPASGRLWLGTGTLVMGLFVVGRPVAYDASRATGWRIGPAQQRALAFLHDETPGDAVILSRRRVDQANFVVSGIGGRASYLELPGNVLERQALRVYPDDQRSERVTGLWLATTTERFCRSLVTTPITHVLEYADEPLRVHDASCIRLGWSSGDGQITIWQVVR